MMVAFDEIAIGVSDFLEHPDQYNPDTLPLETSRITGRGDGDPAEQRANIPEFEAFSPERRSEPMRRVEQQQQREISNQHALFTRRALPFDPGAKASSKSRPEPRAATTEEVTRSSDLKLLCVCCEPCRAGRRS